MTAPGCCFCLCMEKSSSDILCSTKARATEFGWTVSLSSALAPSLPCSCTLLYLTQSNEHGAGEASACLRLSDAAHNCFSLSPLASELMCERWMVCHTLNELNPLKSTVLCPLEEAICINEQRENTHLLTYQLLLQQTMARSFCACFACLHLPFEHVFMHTVTW